VTEQSATDRETEAVAAAREALADAQSVYAAVVGLAELVTGKHGPEALLTLVRQRRLTDDAAGRVWRRSGRQDAPRTEMSMAEYRSRYGFRQVPLDSGMRAGPAASTTNTSTPLGESYEADPLHHPDVVALHAAGRMAEANALAASLAAQREAARPLTSQQIAARENARYYSTLRQRSELSPDAARMRARHPGGTPLLDGPEPA
jgi:hypothetical protein